VPVAVGAAAVLQIPADGVVVVAVDRGYAAFLGQTTPAVDGVGTLDRIPSSTAPRAGRLAWMSVMTAARAPLNPSVSIDKHHFNR
jgi:hypothetical protein